MPKKTKTSEAKPTLERISRRWLLTLWPEYLPVIATPIPIDAPVLEYDIDLDALRRAFQGVKHFRYVAFSVEVGEDKNHKHVQAYLELHNPIRMSALIKVFGATHHFEQSNGSQRENIDYCLHTGTKADKKGLVEGGFELGTMAKAANEDNHETTLYNVAWAMALEGKSIVEISTSCGQGISRIFASLNTLCNEVKKHKDLLAYKEDNHDAALYAISQELKHPVKPITYAETWRRALAESDVTPPFLSEYMQ